MAASMRLDMLASSALLFAFLSFYVVARSAVEAAELLRPRGVSISKSSLYTPETGKFTCLDGSLTVPFEYVNDDYCDCQDGSDEPGTAACPNGTFHCTNAGHRPVNIPSSRVNDGICDCCDASDEYANSRADCTNTCRELGRAARLESQRLEELRRQGYEMRLELSKNGKKVKAAKKERVEELKKEKEEADDILKEREAAKEEAEGPEREALEVYRQAEEEKRKEEEEAKEEAKKGEAEDTFRMLDSNQDGKLDISELQTRQTFDQNKDGVVSEDEAKFFLHMENEMYKEDFLQTGWLLMKPYFMLDRGLFLPPTDDSKEDTHTLEDSAPEEEATGPSEVDEDEAELAKEMQEEVSRYVSARANWELQVGSPDADSDSEDESLNEDKPEESAEPVQPTYDPETQSLIDFANKVRSEYHDAERVVRDLEREIRQTEDALEKEYGEEEEFASMDGECFEHQDMEYTFRLCPFNEVVQKPIQGGSEIRLGTWGSWEGPEENKFSRMKYTGGQSCWNGPTRSTVVNLSCGLENKLTMVTEPSRCEYLAEFTTPAVCVKPEPTEEEFEHDEL